MLLYEINTTTDFFEGADLQVEETDLSFEILADQGEKRRFYTVHPVTEGVSDKQIAYANDVKPSVMRRIYNRIGNTINTARNQGDFDMVQVAIKYRNELLKNFNAGTTAREVLDVKDRVGRDAFNRFVSEDTRAAYREIADRINSEFGTRRYNNYPLLS